MGKEGAKVMVIPVSEEQVVRLEVASKELGAVKGFLGEIGKRQALTRAEMNYPKTGSGFLLHQLRDDLDEATRLLEGIAWTLRQRGIVEIQAVRIQRTPFDFSWENIKYSLPGYQEVDPEIVGNFMSPRQANSGSFAIHHTVASTLFSFDGPDNLYSDYFHALRTTSIVRLRYQPPNPNYFS